MKLTYRKLKLLGACHKQAELFRLLFPRGVVVTTAVCVSVATKFDWSWAAQHLLPEPLLAKYYHQNELLWAKYRRQCVSLWDEYERQCIWAEYERQSALLWAEYDRQSALLFGALAEQVK